MRAWTVTLLLCGVGVAHAATSSVQQPQPARLPRSLTDSGDRWRNLIAEYTRGTSGADGVGGGWFPPAIPIQVPLQGDNSGRASLSVLVVPVPVPVPAPAPAPRADHAQCTITTPQIDNVAPPRNFAVPTYIEPGGPVYNTGYITLPYNPLLAPQPSATPNLANPAPPIDVQYESPTAPPPPRAPPRRPVTDERLARNAPKFPPFEDSGLLVEQFRAQVPDDPSLPPIVIDPVYVVSTADYTVDELREAGSAPDAPAPHYSQARPIAHIKCKKRRSEAGGGGDGGEVRSPPPPTPRFERSLFLRARLTVPRADYTETYSMWWDVTSGALRVDFHGGATSTYRMLKRDGRVQSVQLRLDRTAETDVRRCVVSTPRRMSLAERALPALPDLQAFSFAGYVVRGAGRAELWRHTLWGHSGELGGARGEALTFRHELLVTRSADNHTTTPHWYTVRVDSSVLGVDADGYVHQFDEVQEGHHDSSMFHLDIADACEQVEITDRMERLEPLREFTMLRRDPRYDTEIEQYKLKFGRTYADDVEEAVRKNILIQSSRHTASGNRQGASFELEINFLSERLVVERVVLLGVDLAAATENGEPFPHSLAELKVLHGRLRRNFDWRKHGAVTPVRDQAPCRSCWAFATVGAVEGALYVETKRLLQLSEQALVDCTKPYGSQGCNGSWPSSAFNYIKDHGIPALNEYTPYKGKEQQCRADSVQPVTRISGHFKVTKGSIPALKVAIRKYGPTVVIIDGKATSFVSLKRGYYHDARCRKDGTNHAVLAVGWTERKGETYFILKNSWSTAWGEEGYVRMRAPTDTCGMLSFAMVPRMSSSSVLRVPATAPAAASNNT